MHSEFELQEHTADVAVEATGETIEAIFGALADGLAAASCDSIPDEGGERFEFSVTAESRRALLFEYLDELIYLRDVRLELPVENTVSSIGAPDGLEDEREEDEWRLEASFRGIPVDQIDGREVKAVTYSEMRLEEGRSEWEGYVVFDV